MDRRCSLEEGDGNVFQICDALLVDELQTRVVSFFSFVTALFKLEWCISESSYRV